MLTLVDRAYKINTSVAKFNDDVKEFYYILKKNQYSESLINRMVNSYLDKVHNSNNSKPPKIPLLFILSCHFLTFLILHSVRCVCSLKFIVRIFKLNWNVLLLKLNRHCI